VYNAAASMSILGHLTIIPQLPERIGRLSELAFNLYWSWQPEARRLFRDLDPDLWERSNHSPVALLRDVDQARLEQAAGDDAYLADYDAVLTSFDGYLARPGWFADWRSANGAAAGREAHNYAYFCAEYGWHESVALYSGGLGVLAGDHTKAASDLGVPLVGVGLYYPEGYFHQRVGAEGQQEAVYLRNGATDLPFSLALGEDGRPLSVAVQMFGREVAVQARLARIGKVSVVLLDVDVPANEEADRALLKRLYGGDHRTRIAQEMILGVAGVRMLRALKLAPTSWHMNEGHSAFMALERCRELVAAGLGFAAAREVVAASTVFTVHTPVAAGNDAFGFDLINQCFGGYWSSLGLKQSEFDDLGRADHGWGPVFSMPALALRFSWARNGVAELHGETSRRIWSNLWPGVPVEEVPITHVTNGVHLATWMAPEVQSLVAETLGVEPHQLAEDAAAWRAFRQVDARAFWQVRMALKAQSLRFMRRRLIRQLQRHEASPTALKRSTELFDHEVLTIGFARRFAAYKRATLIFRDMDRLAAILNDPERPVQLVFAGKAHPADQPGQALITQIHNLSKEPRFAGRVLFVEDYDMAIGRAITRGADVWLNNPRRPLEASGTSGQKAAMNGLLNLSILDGWWPEGFDGENGWEIGGGRVYEDAERADIADADALYALLERAVVPLYYDRDADGVPRRWLMHAAAAVASVAPKFNAKRMVQEYVERFYAPASQRGAHLSADAFQAAQRLAAWRANVAEAWPTVELSSTPVEGEPKRVGETVEVSAVLNRNGLTDADVRLEVVYSRAEDRLEAGLKRVPMRLVGEESPGVQRFAASFEPELSGRLVYGVRALAHNSELVSPFDAQAIRWA